MMARRKQRPSRDAWAEAEGYSRAAAAGWILLGLLLGLAGSLYYAWVVDPVIFVDASPARLSEEEKAEYIYLVSQSYALSGDWERAERRLAALDDPNVGETVRRQLEQYVQEQRPPAVLRNMARLARRLGAAGPAVALFAPTPAGDATPSPTPTLTPSPPAQATATATASATPSPSPTPTASATPVPSPTPPPAYRLLTQAQVCDGRESPRLEVVTLDALLNDLPGVAVVVAWERGEDTFFTGFQPAERPGYGDFTMTPGVSYSAYLAAGSPEISGLRAEPCADGTLGGWRLTFQNLQQAVTPTPTPEA
jgi:hypothetical protein